MKFIEMIKTITLILLISLSLVLTYLMWDSAPYDTLGKQATVDISIAESPENKDIEAVIKPYKVNFNFIDQITGTTDSKKIDYMVNQLKEWRISNPELISQSFDEGKLNEFIRRPNQFILYYPDEVPMPVYESVLDIENPNIFETSFDLMIVDWDVESLKIDIHFINRENEFHYMSTTNIYELQAFTREVINVGHSYNSYVDANNGVGRFIAVPSNEVQLVQNIYFPDARDEISPTRFRSALFSDPNAVRRIDIGKYREDFQDNHALMSVNAEKKELKFVHPVVESHEIAIPSELLENTIDFVNEHGGWTDEYRFNKIDFKSRYVSYKLYVRGVPVLGGNTSTEIEQVWGEDTIYEYKRPYYALGDTLPSETETVTLPSGSSIAQALIDSPDVDFKLVEEIIPGYYLNQDNDLNVYGLEPSWFYLQKGKWVRFSSELLGGEKVGLE